MKAQDYYQEYQQKTLEMGFSPIGRKRFNGIIKTISTLDSTIDHIKEKQANEVKTSTEREVCPICKGELSCIPCTKKLCSPLQL